MRREQRDARHVAILIRGRDERRLREVALHRTPPRPTFERFRILHLRPGGSARRQLTHVFDPLHSLGALFGQVLLVPCRREHRLECRRRISLPYRLAEPIHQIRDAGQRLAHVGPQIGHAGGAARGVEHGLPPRQRRTAEHGQRGVPDAAPRHVDDPQEGLVVGGVGDESQIGQEILDLAALIEAHRADEAIRNPAEAEGLFEGP